MITLGTLPVRYEELNDLYAHTDQSHCLNHVSVPLDEEMTRSYFLAVRTGMNQGMPFLARGVYLNRKLIGKAELTVYEEGWAEADLLIRREYENRGYGKAALSMIMKEAEEAQFVRCFTAYIDKENLAMKAVLEQVGFTPARTFRTDVLRPMEHGYALKEIEGVEYVYDSENR